MSAPEKIFKGDLTKIGAVDIEAPLTASDTESHLLVPQIENSLRYVLESHGVDVSNLMSDGTQPVKVLGAIFGIKETTEIFWRSFMFRASWLFD